MVLFISAEKLYALVGPDLGQILSGPKLEEDVHVAGVPRLNSLLEKYGLLTPMITDI